MLFFFCTAHVPSLLLEDFFEHIAYFRDAVDLATKVVHFHKQHTLVHIVFERVPKDPTYITRQKWVIHLVTASPTRWGDLVTVVESAAFNHHTLSAIQLEDAWAVEILQQAHVKQEGQDMEVVLKSVTTFSPLQTVVAITCPIQSAITYFEGDRPLLQEVLPRMKLLRERVRSTIPRNLKSKTRPRREKPWSANEESVRKRVGRLYTDQ